MYKAGLWGLALVAFAIPAFAGDDTNAEETGLFYDGRLNYRNPEGTFEIQLTNQAQVRFTAEDLEDGDSIESFDIPRYKLRLEGRAWEHWGFRLQTDLARGSNSSRQLLEDAYVRWDRFRLAQIQAGQGKVYFGRQSLISTGDLMFTERSLATEEFQHTKDGSEMRDVGLAFLGETPVVQYQFGVYNGNGINKDAKDNSDYMVTGRVLITPFGEFPLLEVDTDHPGALKLAVGVAGMRVTKGTDALSEETEETTLGVELALKVWGLILQGEYFTRDEKLPTGLPTTDTESEGWYAQAGYLFFDHLGLGLRYSETTRDLAGNPEATETGAAFNWYLAGHDRKLQLDYRDLDFKGPQAGENVNRKELRFQLQLVF